MTDAEAVTFLEDAGGPPRGGRIEPKPKFSTDIEAMAFLAADPEPLQPAAQEAADRNTRVLKAIEEPEKPEITFTGKDAAFRYTGGMVADPMTGQVQPTGGAIVFDQSTPERFSQGIEEAWQAGLMPGDQYAKLKEAQAPVLKVMEDRRKLESKMATNPRLAAVMTGAGRGGAATLGAIGGAKLLGAGGAVAGTAIAGPAGTVVGGVAGGTIGAIGGGISAAMGFEQLQRVLGNHFEEYDNTLKAAELYPLETMGGQLALAVPAMGGSLVQGGRALATTASGPAGLAGAVRQGAAAIGAGAATGAVAYPIDAAVRGEPITPGGMAAATGMGAAMGGFFLQPGATARNPELAAIAQKMAARQPLTAQEAAVAQSMEAAEGQIRGQARFVNEQGGMNPRMDVEVPTASVAGLMPSAGRARVSTEYFVPPKLPASAQARLAVVRQQRAETPVVPAQVATPEVMVTMNNNRPGLMPVPPPRVAPVNVLAPGAEPIAATEQGAPAAAMMAPIDFVERMAAARGQEIFAPEAETEMLDEHFQVVKSAVARQEPVSTAALDFYEMRVPFYERSEETGLATFSEKLFEEHWKAVTASQREDLEQSREGGVELLAAVMDAGGLPAFRSGESKAIWSGELKSLWETARAAGSRHNTSSDNKEGVAVTKLFRRDAPDLDKLVLSLQGKGFKVETEADLIELLDNRLRSGKHVYAYGAAEDPYMAQPVELAGRRPRAPQGDQPMLLGEDQVDFTLAGQTDRTSLTPEEMQRRAQEAERKAEADRLQGDLFGEQAGTRLEPVPQELAQRIAELQAGEETQVDTSKKFWLIASSDGDIVEITDNAPDAKLYFETMASGGEWLWEYADGITTQHPVLQRGVAERRAEGYIKTAEQERRQAQTVAEGRVFYGGADTSAETPASAGEIPRYTPDGRAWQGQEETVVYHGGKNIDPYGSQQAPQTLKPRRPQETYLFGKPAKVPPGQPVGITALRPPDWVLKPGETSEGRRLIKGIANFKPGQQFGFRSIVDLLNRAVQVEMRKSRSQTSGVHPAHHRPGYMLVFTRETQSQINFHEAGHGLQNMLLSRDPLVLNPHEAELVALTKRPGSMASDPPAAASAAQKAAYVRGEGVAEWLRLRTMDPQAVERLKVTPALEAATEKYYPGVAAALRDGARAAHVFNQQPAAVRWQMFNTMPMRDVSPSELVGAIVRGGEAIGRLLASGSPVSAMDRKMFRAIVANREQVGMTARQAVAAARRVRKEATQPMMDAYNMILSLGQEVQLAMSGAGPSKGLRVIGKDGNFVYFSKATWRDMRRRIPAGKVTQFDAAAWALESLERWEKNKLEYPGMREGITPDELRGIVQAAQREIPAFGQLFAEQMNFQNSLLELKEYGGLLSAEERAKIQGTRDTYWPMPRAADGVIRTGGAGKGGGDVQAGVFRARGGDGPIRQVDEVTEERARQALEAYYWNRFGNTMVDRLRKVAMDKSLPIEARAMAGNAVTPMKMPREVAATVTREEALGWVLEAIKDAVEAEVGFRPELTAEDVNLSWNFRDVWRPTKPGDANVISLLRDGNRTFYQLGDPAMFGLFANPQVASPAGKFVAWAAGPMTQNWKRAITQGPVFAMRNLFRDMFTQTILNPDPIGWVPGAAHFQGVVNKWTRKYPQVMQEGLLLSRIQPTDTELVSAVRHGAVWQWFTEGLYVSQAKDPVVRLLATVLQPSNWLFPLWKTADVFNLITGGRTAAQFFETAGREGAAVSVLKRGGTDEQALAKYWSAAGQFNEHAGVADARIAMSIQGFTNPMFQGTRNAMQRLTDPDPAVRGTAWTRLLVMMPLLFGGAAVMRYLTSSDADRERERQRPVDQRMNFMDLGGFAVPFPFGPEGAMASMIFNATLDDLLSRPKVDAEKSAWTLLKKIGGDVSPLQLFGPQLATLMEARMNWSEFQQRNIVSPWMINLPASEQYYSTTPKFYRGLGKMLDYSPAKLQYIVQQGISRQLDEVIRMVEAVDRGRPMQEPGDIPFVGRLWTRDPIGFNSQAVREAQDVEARLQLLDTRLNANGWSWLREENVDLAAVQDPKLRALGVQLAQLRVLRQGLRALDRDGQLAKYASLKGDYLAERNIRAAQVLRTQAVMSFNEPLVGKIDTAMQMLEAIGPASPEAQAADYWRRAR